VTVTAEDGAGNTATSYAGTVSITSSDSSAVLPSSSTLTSGVKAFSITLKTAPSQTVTASDGTLSRTSSAITVNAGAVSLSHSTFTLSQSTLTSGSTATATLVLKDSSGNQIADSSQAANLTFSVLTTGTSTGTLGAITPVGGNAGAYQATFTAKTSGTANTVSASLSGLGSFSATPSFTVSAGSASASVSTLSASPTSIPADGSTSSTITVTLLDSNSNPVSGKSITLASSRSGDVIAPASVTTLSNGVAQFTVKSTTAGSSSYTATDTTDASLVLSQQATVTFTAGLPSATLSTVVPNPTASVVANGTNTSIVTVTLLDTYSNPVQNKTVTLTSSRGATDTISAASGASNSSGQVTFTVSSTTVGTPVLTAKDTTDNITLSTQPSVTFIAGPAANIAIFSGNYQNTIPGSATASSMVVLVTDANSNPVNNAAVNWSVNNTADTLASSSSTTGANGQTSNTLTFNSSATTTGADTVTATLVSTGTNVTFTESVQVILAINNVKTSQGTTSTSFTNLTTLDAVSITVAASTQVVIEYYANIQTTGTATSEIFVDGTGIANSQISTADVPWSGNQYQYQSQALETITTLSAGTHTIAVEHASSSTSVTSSWIDRTLTVTHGSAVIASNFVATAQTIASGTIEDLATPDKVTFTLTQSTPIYVSYVAQALKSSIGTNYSYVYIDGVQEAVYYAATSNANQMQIAPYVTTLAAGTHTIDIQHECDDNNCTWSQRQLTVFYGSPVLLASSYVATSQTTTSTTFVDLATVDYVTFSLNAQQYVDIQYFDSNSNTAFTTCQSVVLVDGVEDTGTIAYQSSHAWSGNMVIQDRVQLSAGSHTIKVQHETASSSSCAFLGRLLTVKGSPELKSGLTFARPPSMLPYSDDPTKPKIRLLSTDRSHSGHVHDFDVRPSSLVESNSPQVPKTQYSASPINHRTKLFPPFFRARPLQACDEHRLLASYGCNQRPRRYLELFQPPHSKLVQPCNRSHRYFSRYNEGRCLDP
jgi:hypothetical protein